MRLLSKGLLERLENSSVNFAVCTCLKTLAFSAYKLLGGWSPKYVFSKAHEATWNKLMDVLWTPFRQCLPEQIHNSEPDSIILSYCGTEGGLQDRKTFHGGFEAVESLQVDLNLNKLKETR